MTNGDVTDSADVRGSAPVMSTKDLLLELYHDMKFVRPAVETLLAAGVVARIERLEVAHIAAQTAKEERSRIGNITNKTIVLVVLVTNFLVGLSVIVVNLVEHIR